jgi:hypothetical protein
VRKIYQKDTPEKPNTDYKRIFSSPKYIVDKLLKVFLFPLLILTIFFIKRDSKYFTSIGEIGCGDKVTSERLGVYAERLESKIF